jgi:hypothetical protein
MVIDQRNAGASVTITGATSLYSADRWLAAAGSSTGVYTIQQVSDVPVGFVNSLKVTVTTAEASVANSYEIIQRIEGFNTADLSFGTANAKTVTLSFWVKSSLTGSFGGSLCNNAFDRVYPFTYTINAANTWEYKTVTIAGDTTGTWLTNNSTGIQLNISLGASAARSATANAWTTTSARQPTGSVNLISTNGATFYITGVQLEQNTSATPFERRLYNQELANCQRYLPAFGGSAGALAAGFCSSTIYGFANVVFPVTTRTAPTGITVPNVTYWSVYGAGATAYAATAATFSTASTTSSSIYFTVASGLGAGQGTIVTANNASAQLLFTGCEL